MRVTSYINKETKQRIREYVWEWLDSEPWLTTDEMVDSIMESYWAEGLDHSEVEKIVKSTSYRDVDLL